MSTPLSIRFPDLLADRVRARGVGLGETASGMVVRLVDEGMRMADHPGIVFRDGPTGRRAGLMNGPDVWEVIVVLCDYAYGRGASPVRSAAKALALTESAVRTAENYYAAFPDEIDARIAANAAAADDARRAASTRSRLYQ